MNSRITPKERGLLKGAIRRVFSRSELRRRVIEAARVDHKDPARPRVTKWVLCAECKRPAAAYQAQVDHMDPIVSIEQTLESMDWETVVNKVWCEENRLQVLDKTCHTIKTKEENKLRRAYKKGKSTNVKRSKVSKKSATSNCKRVAPRGNKRSSIRTTKKAYRR